VDDIERRRRAEGYNFRGEGLRALGRVDTSASVSNARDCLFCGEGLRTISTSCGFPTDMNETSLAVSSCDFRLDPLDEGAECAVCPSASSLGEKSTKDSESEYSSKSEASSSLERYNS